jgi:hypothetical protein
MISKNLIGRRQYNDRRKLLFEKTDDARKSMAEGINKQGDVFVIHSVPLEICKISRKQRNKMGKESAHHSPDKDYCGSRKKYFMAISYAVFILKREQYNHWI